MHDNIVSLSLNGREAADSPLLATVGDDSGKGDVNKLENWLKELSLSDLLALVDDLDQEDISFLEEGVRYNLDLAEYGLKHGNGLGIGKTLERLVRQRFIQKEMCLTTGMCQTGSRNREESWCPRKQKRPPRDSIRIASNPECSNRYLSPYLVKR